MDDWVVSYRVDESCYAESLLQWYSQHRVVYCSLSSPLAESQLRFYLLSVVYYRVSRGPRS